MFVSVIIINYNTFQVTCNCVESVIKHTAGVLYEIILVDNASPEDNPDDFLIRFPKVSLIKSPKNGGFSKGNNLGIAASKGDVILLLNSDTVLTEDSISEAAKCLASNGDIGALTVRLVYPDGKLQHTARKFRSLRNELLDVFRPVLKMMPYKWRAATLMNQYFNGDFDTDCDWVSGAFMMFRRNILDMLPDNKLDERYFMYGEDQLWCYQFKQLGFRNHYLSSTTVIHIHNASTAPGKQLLLTKKLLDLELDLMQIRIGKSVTYYLFGFVYKSKELLRYYIKLLAFKFFGYRIR